MRADATELRVLGCLLEKQRTTPDAYPLSLNALRLACNQSTNRDPVLDLGEGEIREALDRLGRRRWTRLTSTAGSRTPKFRHLLDEALRVDGAQLALLGVLMLRGPQTLGELRTRTERLHGFGSLDEVREVLLGLAAREMVQTVRRPGWKEERWMHLLGADDDEGGVRGVERNTQQSDAVAPRNTQQPDPVAEPWRATHEPDPTAEPSRNTQQPDPAVERTTQQPDPMEAIAELRAEVAALRDEVRALRDELGA